MREKGEVKKVPELTCQDRMNNRVGDKRGKSRACCRETKTASQGEGGTMLKDSLKVISSTASE